MKLKQSDVNQPERSATPLADWGRAFDVAMARGEAEMAARMAQLILDHIPRHLATYQRLLRVTWTLKRWEEGEDWARRLLQADPGNPWAWQALAAAAEQRGQRAQANAMWQRAFEMSPYAPEIRAGLARTSLDEPNALSLDFASLAMIYLRGMRWEPAARAYRQLVKADPRRIDFQLCLMAALWQNRAHEEAYALARHLVQSHPNLLLAWVVLEALGDANDKALAAHPITSMDADGEFVTTLLGTPQVTGASHLIYVDPVEAEWLASYLEAASR
jgi:tetratricopeptide (TPR) repeat protein